MNRLAADASPQAIFFQNSISGIQSAGLENRYKREVVCFFEHHESDHQPPKKMSCETQDITQNLYLESTGAEDQQSHEKDSDE